MKLFMPKQHGAWAMLFVPFGLGIVAGGFHWLQVLLGLGWVPLYLSTYPLLLAVKRKKVQFHLSWFMKYLITALIFIGPVLYFKPMVILIGSLMLPFFLLNIYFSSTKKDRLFFNDISAIMAFSVSGIATYYLGNGLITSTAWFIWGVSVLFFVGSTFFVKSMIREKKNPTFRWVSWVYHLLVCVLFLLLGRWLISLALLPSLVRAIVYPRRVLRPMKIGIIEIINSVLFFIVVSLYFIL